MSDTKTSQAIGQLGLTILFCTLLTLKVTGPLADTSWWWITAPIWGPAAFLLGILAVAAFFLAIGRFVDYVGMAR